MIDLRWGFIPIAVIVGTLRRTVEKIGGAIPKVERPALDGGQTKLAHSTFEPSHGAGQDVSQALEEIAARLYPLGPTDQDIWARAGGDISQLQLASKTGRAAWFGALRILSLGGGGKQITKAGLIRSMLSDYPKQRELLTLLSSN